jgi:hypothetical protein
MNGELVNRAGWAKRQGFAKIVGRVGALAVFLGVGTVFAMPGVALADDDATPSAEERSVSSPPRPGSQPGIRARVHSATSPVKSELRSAVTSTLKSAAAKSRLGSAEPTNEGQGGDGADPDSGEVITGGAAADDDSGNGLGARPHAFGGHRASSPPLSEFSASTVKVAREAAGKTSPNEPTTIDPETTPQTAAPSAEALRAAGSPVVERVSPRRVVSPARVVTESMTALFAPLPGGDPIIPATSPAAWSLLAYTRRELGSEAGGALTNVARPLGISTQLTDDALAADRPRLLRSFVTGFLKLATEIGVGLERTAAGLEDSPLDALVGHIEQRYGYLPALVVRTAFDGLIAALGPILLADVDPLEPVSGSIDVNNAIAESATFEVNSDQYLIDIGSPQNVGNGEFARVIAGAIDGDSDDSDIHQILAELYTGKSRTLTNRRAGIDGVTLVEITPTSYTLALNNNGVVDTLTLTGPVVEDAVAQYLEEPTPPGNGWRTQLRMEFGALLSDLRERPLATIVEQVQFTLSDTLNFAFSIPPLRALFEAIAPGLNVADADPLTEEPVIDVANGISETATLAIPTGEFVFEIGDPFGVGTNGGFSFLSTLLRLPISELSGILRAEVDADDNDNDAQQLLEEILNGRSGAVLDFETEPGIDGVALVGLTPTSFTLAFEDGEATDRLTLEGPGAEAILADFDARAGADLADGQNNISLIEIGSDTLELGDEDNNPIYDLVGNEFAGDDDLDALIAAAKDPAREGVTLISEDQASISIRIDNPTTGEFDLLVFSDPNRTTGLI